MKEARIPAIIALILSVSVVSQAATYGGGSGTAESPYEIRTAEQMNTIGLNRDDWDKHFKLMADIDMAAYSGTQYNMIGDYDPITRLTYPFTGTFDGNCHIIRNFTYAAIDDTGTYGLFSITVEAFIRDLSLDAICVSVNRDARTYIGGLVGEAWSSEIVNCHVSGSVTGTVLSGLVGGLMGTNWFGTITNCSSSADISINAAQDQSEVGGLVGMNVEGTLTGCFSSGQVSSTFTTGGLAGGSFYGFITSCYSSSQVTGLVGQIGGLLGYNDQTLLTSCYAIGSTKGGVPVGRLFGYNGQALLESFYPIGVIQEGILIGGLVGNNYHGGFYGREEACFWDIQTTGQTESGLGRGLTTEQMKTMSIYQDAGWADKGWVIDDGQDYPRLEWENTGGVPIPQPQALALAGSGTAEEPYLISTPEEFASLSWYSEALDKHFRLTTNLDLSGVSLYPIGDYGLFTGEFDGSEHTISNAVIKKSKGANVGLFGILGSQGTIQNLIVENAFVTGCNSVGALTGNVYWGTVTNCHISGLINGDDSVGGLSGEIMFGAFNHCSSTASVSGISYTGGLLGLNYESFVADSFSSGSVLGETCVGGLVGFQSGCLEQCYATGSVNGTDRVGGLVGGHDSTDFKKGPAGNKAGYIFNCYANGRVSGTSKVGGLLGDNRGKIINSYATGKLIGSVDVGGLCGDLTAGNTYENTGDFWNIETTGIDTSAMGTGLSTAQMQTRSTFADAGWDFETVWAICDGTNYPRLRWQIPAADWVCPDGVRNEDLAYLAARWMTAGCGASEDCGGADLDADGAVGLSDLAAFVEAWLH